MSTPCPNTGTIPFPTILNFRDVGQHINHLSGREILQPGLLYRSARPDAATPADQRRLRDDLGIKTILDLRTPTEHEEARKLLSTTSSSSSSSSSSSPSTTAPGTTPPHGPPTPPSFIPQDPTSPLQIPGITTQTHNLNGKPYTASLLSQLTWPQTLQLYALYATGYRKAAIAVLARNVMAPRGLAGLAVDTLTHSRTEVGEVFGVLAQENAWPVLVHCTQGKDRTGLIVLLLLLLCGVEEGAIEADYLASQQGLAAERAAKVEEVRSIGFPDDFADCEVGWTRRVMEWIKEEGGGVEGYLEGCGITGEERRRVRKRLVR